MAASLSSVSVTLNSVWNKSRFIPAVWRISAAAVCLRAADEGVFIETPPSLPYMIRRSRMHNIPVYSDIKHGNQKSSVVRKVEGDIWALNKDVKEYLWQLTGREPPTKVNEVTMSIRVKGSFDKELKEWLLKLGF